MCMYAVHGVQVKQCAGTVCHQGAPSQNLRAFRLRFSRDLVSWESSPDRFCVDCVLSDPVAQFLSKNAGPVLARYVKVDSFEFTGCCQDSARSIRLGFFVNLPSNATANNAECLSANDCGDCMRKSATADCSWVSSVSGNNVAGVCVGAKDGFILNYPYYTPNKDCAATSSNCVAIDGLCLPSRSRAQCSYDKALHLASPVTCRSCVESGCFFQSNFVSTSSSASQSSTSGKCVSQANESPSCAPFLYYYAGGRCQPRSNQRIPSCAPASPTYTPALQVPQTAVEFNSPPAPFSPPARGPALFSGKTSTDTEPEEESSPSWVTIPIFVVWFNVIVVLKYCKSRGIENTAYIFFLSVLIGPLVWFIVIEEAKQVERRRQEEANAEMTNPYVTPFNPFDLAGNFPTSLDPDVILPPPPNPYTSNVPRFDPDSSWTPPPNPYTRMP